MFARLTETYAFLPIPLRRLGWLWLAGSVFSLFVCAITALFNAQYPTWIIVGSVAISGALFYGIAERRSRLAYRIQYARVMVGLGATALQILMLLSNLEVGPFPAVASAAGCVVGMAMLVYELTLLMDGDTQAYLRI
ncbi:MAG: hypothetical protein AAF645_09880 [Myxococcota bacterium]